MNFRNFALTLLLGCAFVISEAQILQPVTWTGELSKTNVKAGEEVEVILRATIDKGWYIYSVGFDPDCGPFPTGLSLEDNAGFELQGELKAINDVKKFDKIFDCEVRIFESTAEFRQKVKVLGSNPDLNLVYDGQVCSETEGKCIPFEGDLSFRLSIASASVAKEQPQKKEEPKPDNSLLNTPTFDPSVTEDSSSAQTADTKTAKLEKQYGKNEGPVLDRDILEGEQPQTKSSLFGYMVLAFVLGLTSLITPCVFPMIPMTVTFFLKDNQSKQEGVRKALIFGISIIVIYTVAGTIFAFLFGPEGLNALATHWLPNLLVFVIFLVFAMSFLGLFEINAPHRLVNRADRAAEKGGLGGIFFMSATLVLVSFSCTIPIVGNVLVLAAGGEVVKPVLGMFAYSLAFAVPFTLFAFFPEWLKGLPKSGGWLNTVKVTLGLLELALAFKFLSIADQTYHWGILDRDVNIAIWVVIFSVLGFYFLGKIRMPHDSPVDKVSVPRLLLSIATFSFVVYLIPGLWGAPLKALAGYLPPLHTHDFNLVTVAREGEDNAVCEPPKYDDFLHLPHGLEGYFDYDQALSCARKLNKPLFIDFTGHGCTNCREMEAVVWSDPRVLERLRNDFVVVALYVDDKTELPEEEWITSTHDGKVKKTIGRKNADLQITNLDNNAQPFYVLVGEDERLLTWPYDYNRSVEDFIAFLDYGKKKYHELYGAE